MDGKPDLRPCPFCGNRELRYMMLNVSKIKVMVGVKCQKCLTCGPGECGKNREEAEEKAAEAWNRRAEPENRVLTLEEAAESGDPVWLEAMGTARIAQIYLSPGESLAECKTIGRAYPEYLYTGDYGKLWRCWLRKPTAEEMANTTWEE